MKIADNLEGNNSRLIMTVMSLKDLKIWPESRRAVVGAMSVLGAKTLISWRMYRFDSR